MNELDAIIARIPELGGSRAADFRITSLPGYTNRNYRLRRAQADWVLRVPRADTDRFIDRAAEAHNQSLAAELGIAPRVTWRDDDGVTLTRTLATARNLATADFGHADGLRTIVEPLWRLHRSGLRFRGSVDLAELLSRYTSLLDPQQQRQLRPRLRQAERILGRLEVTDAANVASHNDLVLENLLLAPDRLWLIDWEYSSMASPYWDLATLCNAASLDLARSRLLLQAYCADGEPMEESILFDYRGLLQLLGDCWMAAFARD